MPYTPEGKEALQSQLQEIWDRTKANPALDKENRTITLTINQVANIAGSAMGAFDDLEKRLARLDFYKNEDAHRNLANARLWMSSLLRTVRDAEKEA
jgi:hypothetical protein